VKAYPPLALAATAALSPPPLAAAEIAIIPALYKLKGAKLAAALVAAAAAIAQGAAQAAGLPAAIAASLPVALALDQALKEAAPPKLAHTKGLKPAKSLKTLIAAIASSAAVAAALRQPAILASSLTLAAYTTAATAKALADLKGAPIAIEAQDTRLIAGATARVEVKAKSKAPRKVYAHIKAGQKWAKLEASLEAEPGEEKTLKLTLTPKLAGSHTVELQVTASDERGLLLKPYTLTPLEVAVIPKAKYARWLALKYLEKPASQHGAKHPKRRGGEEYYSSRPYQPGDRLKDIDWKHTLKLRKLTVKEYTGGGAQPVVIAVNTAPRSKHEADEIAHKALTAALTAAAEESPTSIAAYSSQSIAKATPPQNPRLTLKELVKLTQAIKPSPSPENIVEPPKTGELPETPLKAAEEKFLKQTAAQHPLTKALQKTAWKTPPPATVVIASDSSHDTEAAWLQAKSLTKKGYTVVHTKEESQKTAATHRQHTHK